ncbi:NB-ARC domains-containing protein [Tanacetum coccineum]
MAAMVSRGFRAEGQLIAAYNCGVSFLKEVSSDVCLVEATEDLVKESSVSTHAENEGEKEEFDEVEDDFKKTKEDVDNISSIDIGCFNLIKKYIAGRNALSRIEDIEHLIEASQLPLQRVDSKSPASTSSSCGNTQIDWECSNRIGNAVTEGRYLVFGIGAMQLLSAAIYALASENTSSPSNNPSQRVTVENDSTQMRSCMSTSEKEQNNHAIAVAGTAVAAADAADVVRFTSDGRGSSFIGSEKWAATKIHQYIRGHGKKGPEGIERTSEISSSC